MRILTLIENTRDSRKLQVEHGLSFFVELNGKNVLIDTGASDKFMRNAEKLQVFLDAPKLSQETPLEACVVSHNHADHIGGLEALLKARPDLKVYASKHVRGNYYRKVGPFNVVICWNRNFLNKHSQNFVLFEKFQQVCEGFYVMGCEVHNEHYVRRDRRLLMKEYGKHMTRFVPDDFKHEIFAVIFPSADENGRVGRKEREKGCVVISSCSHSGIVNILETVKQTWPDSPILGVIGGFHMQDVPGVNDSFIKRVAGELMRLSDGCVYTCHCTGEKAYERLKSYMGDQIQTLRTGEELTF
ncbi:MAG: MBL fold metallo-hydrolase [Oscillospiraceae bacterium]|nr:MBL fold metallo-hydrolase [Oscillospiraceae bacterium]